MSASQDAVRGAMRQEREARAELNDAANDMAEALTSANCARLRNRVYGGNLRDMKIALRDFDLRTMDWRK